MSDDDRTDRRLDDAADDAADEPAEAPLDAYSRIVTRVAHDLLPSMASLAVRSPRGQGTGSASVISDDGVMLTSAHVVVGAGLALAGAPGSRRGRRPAHRGGERPSSRLGRPAVDTRTHPGEPAHRTRSRLR